MSIPRVEDAEGDPAVGQVVGELGKLVGRPPQAGQRGDHEGVALAQGAKKLVPLGPRCALFTRSNWRLPTRGSTGMWRWRC